MPKYAVRVELNGPPDADVYSELHDEMRRIGYSRVIEADSGAWWRLPDAMYVGDDMNEDVVPVRDYIKAIVQSVWASCEIIVFRYDHAAWHGLTRIP